LEDKDIIENKKFFENLYNFLKKKGEQYKDFDKIKIEHFEAYFKEMRYETKCKTHYKLNLIFI